MHTISVSDQSRPLRLREVSLDHPWRWLAAGWLDMCSEPALSYFYGAVFAALGTLMLVGLEQWGMAWLILPLAFGFALVGPMAAVGLYEISRRLDAGEAVGLGAALGAVRRNPGQIALVGMFLVVALLVWVRLAMLEFMLFFGNQPPTLDHLLGAVLSPEGVPFLLVGMASGAAMAVLTFAMTAIAVPLLVDRPDCDAVTAMLTSLETVRRNFRPMMLWAFLAGSAALVGVGLFFVGLVVVLPLLGHATWHAYRDLVESQK